MYISRLRGVIVASLFFTNLIYVSSVLAGVISAPILNPANGHTYLLLDSTGWLESEAEAITLGGHLVTINDQAENNFVFGTFGSFGGTTRSLWIGLNDADIEGSFVWTSGEPVTYLNWESRAPNNANGNEDYVHMEPNAVGWPEPGKWNDLANFTSGNLLGIPLHGVVEISQVPIPPAVWLFGSGLIGLIGVARRKKV